MDDTKPKPGTNEAIELGCLCPVMDNNHGEGIPVVNATTQEVTMAYWINTECVIHGTKEK